MKTITYFILTTFGTAGIFISSVLFTVLSVFPLLMFEMSWWLYMLLALILQFFIYKIPLAFEVLWIVGLVEAISGPQNIFTVIYYILFAIIIVPTLVRIVKALLF